MRSSRRTTPRAWSATRSRSDVELDIARTHTIHHPSDSAPNVPGTPTLGLYQPRALHAVAPLLLPNPHA
eukprot:scaffold38146_cov60-Phaeocystis_antarctica.AAC.1